MRKGDGIPKTLESNSILRKKMVKYSLDGRVIPTMNGFKEYENGGKGSGNFGHAGREGKVGGSAPTGKGGKSSGVKGGTKAEKEAIKGLLGDYYEERGIEGIIEDAEAAAEPRDVSNIQKARRLVEGGNFGVSYDDAFEDLKSIYGEDFKESTYKTKDGGWKTKGGEAYVWTIYKEKLAKTIADEMDKQGSGKVR